jgi:hypothetical protein
VRLYYRKVGSGAQTVIVPASLFLYRDLSALATGAAHMPWIDQPTVVFPAIDQFLKGEWPPNAESVAYPGNQ